MNLHPHFTAFLAFIVLTAGCKKDSDPCEGVLDEALPPTVTLKFIDQQTGENLILLNDISEDDITITAKNGVEKITDWQIRNVEGSESPFNGTLTLTCVNETEGEYLYDIQLGNAGSASLSYTIQKTTSDAPCRFYSFPMSDIKITDHDYEVAELNGTKDPSFLILGL